MVVKISHHQNFDLFQSNHHQVLPWENKGKIYLLSSWVPMEQIHYRLYKFYINLSHYFISNAKQELKSKLSHPIMYSNQNVIQARSSAHLDKLLSQLGCCQRTIFWICSDSWGQMKNVFKFTSPPPYTGSTLFTAKERFELTEVFAFSIEFGRF